MKFFLGILLIVVLTELSFATRVLTQHDMPLFKKYQKQEPPIDRHTTFANAFVETKWIEQRLNNFDPQDKRTWNMRYMENSDYFQPGGPIFIYIGGEWTISAGWLLGGHMHDMALVLNGTMFYTEHRYYGQSHPTPNISTENLRFLTVDQALADLAHFIVKIKSENEDLKDSGVILVGASYAATMATWFMQKYPQHANGSWASSAPLKAKVDFYEYNEVVSQAIESRGGQACANRIRNAVEMLESLASNGNSAEIERIYRLCYPFVPSNLEDVWSFFYSVSGPFAWLVQYHSENYRDIQNECEYLTSIEAENDLEALALWYFGGPANPEAENPFCFNHIYSNFTTWYTGIEWSSVSASSAYRQWLYQTCAEFGWFQSSGSDDILFGSNFPADFNLAICRDVFDDGVFTSEDVHGNADRVNTFYGAFEPNVRNVYSTHGEFDPWRPMGVQEDINKSSPTTILPLETHCSDLYSISARDSPEMVASKQKIFYLVQDWLQIRI